MLKKGPLFEMNRKMTLRPTPRWVVWICSLEIFILVASNGRPFWTSSGAWITVTAAILIFGQGINRQLNYAFSGRIRCLSLAMFFLILANLISAIANPSALTFAEVGLRTVLPFIVYLSLLGLVLHPSDATILAYSLMAGAAVMFLRGFFAYVGSVGSLDFQTVLWARYDPVLMSAYSDATLGNVGRIGPYILLVLPVIVWTAISRSLSLVSRFMVIAIFALALTNLLFSGSRTSLALSFFQIAAIAMARGLYSRIIVFFAMIGLTVAIMNSSLYVVYAPDLIERFLPSFGQVGEDASANERLASVEEGWRIFVGNMAFGIGPGNSPLYNTFSIPHQSTIYQFSELGIVGGVVYLILCIMIIRMNFRALRDANRNADTGHFWIWTSGPAFWIIYGIFAGIAFTASLALVWVGIAYAMLAVGSAKILPVKSRYDP